MNQGELSIVSVCTGSAMLEYGIGIVFPRARVIRFYERDGYAAACLVERMEEQALDDAPVAGDIVPESGRALRGCVDMLTCGYPCQPFSIAGKQLGFADERNMWPAVAGLIDAIRPRWIFLENVANHVQKGFERVRADLQALGYRVEAGLFEASEMGAPHGRRRLFALCMENTGYHEPHEPGQQTQKGTRANQRPPRRKPAPPGGSENAVAHAGVRTGSAGAERPGRTPRANACGCGQGPGVENTARNERGQRGRAGHDGEILPAGGNGCAAQRQAHGHTVESVNACKLCDAGCARLQGKRPRVTATDTTGPGQTGSDNRSTHGSHREYCSIPPRPSLANLCRGLSIALEYGDRCVPIGRPRLLPACPLNPRWIETLMGWPIGWTKYGSSVAALSQFKPQWRFYICSRFFSMNKGELEHENEQGRA